MHEVKQMKKTIIASLAVLASAAVVTTFALGGSSKLNAIFETKATGKSFVFAAATGSQFEDTAAYSQTVDVTTGVSDPIIADLMPRHIDSLAFGQNGRFVEAHPIADEGKFPYYSLTIGINNLTHFEIDVGVENDGDGAGNPDMYDIELLAKGGLPVMTWNSSFEPDEKGNGTKHIEWYKGVSDSTVVEVFVQLSFENDSADTNLYIESMTLSWNC